MHKNSSIYGIVSASVIHIKKLDMVICLFGDQHDKNYKKNGIFVGEFIKQYSKTTPVQIFIESSTISNLKSNSCKTKNDKNATVTISNNTDTTLYRVAKMFKNFKRFGVKVYFSDIRQQICPEFCYTSDIDEFKNNKHKFIKNLKRIFVDILTHNTDILKIKHSVYGNLEKYFRADALKRFDKIVKNTKCATAYNDMLTIIFDYYNLCSMFRVSKTGRIQNNNIMAVFGVDHTEYIRKMIKRIF